MARGQKIGAKQMIRVLMDSKDLRIKIFKELLNHIKSGYSVDCFAPLSEPSIRAFLKDFPSEFVQEEFDSARRKAKEHWEDIGKRQAQGTCLGNSRSWYYNMSNRYGWSDRQQIDVDAKCQANVSIVNYAKPIAPTDIPQQV